MRLSPKHFLCMVGEDTNHDVRVANTLVLSIYQPWYSETLTFGILLNTRAINKTIPFPYLLFI
ncbi:hypothetical protein GQF61_15845 [Sphingobacterium sp. DK4209]|uniref:Uncharacterized protein n=1 Tax=Sphingobacterium zhuxiongii TaxID=2662364 RepID=A0A5Q0Q4T2_9SPHI|nr:hypothetical protein [Sphingobacterium sp. DK4209]MVZ67329.1 hypothetical protein [Sphingobacterium sp. DK4209]QGA25065.1 hypothetical protein GFH32_01430 [Sphingobacterium sp. dk4302]